METLLEWTPRLGALLVLLIGLIGFFRPAIFTVRLGIELVGPDAWSEMRALLGGLNIGAALGALHFQTPEVYMTLGLAWLFALLARLWSIARDGMTLRASLPALAVDGALALLLLSGLLR